MDLHLHLDLQVNCESSEQVAQGRIGRDMVMADGCLAYKVKKRAQEKQRE